MQQIYGILRRSISQILDLNIAGLTCSKQVRSCLILLSNLYCLYITVGVLTEVPVMLILVKIANNTKHWFPDKSMSKN
jgi:hypothetical protein